MYKWIILDTSTSDFYRANDRTQAVQKLEGLANSGTKRDKAERAKQLILLQRMDGGVCPHYLIVEIEWTVELTLIALLK